MWAGAWRHDLERAAGTHNGTKRLELEELGLPKHLILVCICACVACAKNMWHVHVDYMVCVCLCVDYVVHTDTYV